jgi:hypothetical protein
MRSRCLSVFFGPFLIASCWFSCACAMAATPFAIAATNVTMPSTGNGSSQYTVTGIPGTGTLTISCAYSGPTTVAKIPTCSYGPILALPVSSGTQMGEVYFYLYGVAVPLKLPKASRRSGYLPATGLEFAGALLLGFGLRRRAWRWLTLLLLAVGALAGLAGIFACGSSGNGMTPGTYPYTILAQWESSGPAILRIQTTTTITVTVP